MKKGILRVLSLALVAAMLLACTSCTQTILVRFVDAEGNDLDLVGGSVPVNSDVTPSDETPATEQPTAPPASEAPSSQAPASETPSSQAPASEAPSAQAPVTQAPPAQAPATQAPAQTGGMPTTKDAIVNFYKDAVAKVKNNGAGGYTKKEWQVLDDINIGASAVNEAVKGLAGNFMTPADKAENQVCAKGSDDAKNRFPEFTLTDYSKIASAKCEAAGSNYKITIVLADEDTPKKGTSFVGKATNSILYWEDIDNTLKSDGAVKAVLSSYSNIHVIYKAFTIVATITPDGKFVSMDHTAPADIIIGEAKILKIFTIKDKSGHLVNYCTYRDFKY